MKELKDKEYIAIANGWRREFIQGNGVDRELWVSPEKLCYDELPEEAYINKQSDSVTVRHFILPLDLAFIRWSVVHRGWHEIGGDCPLLLAFLAGWSCRCIGASMPEDIGQFTDSFRVGWREADDQIKIASRQKT